MFISNRYSCIPRFSHSVMDTQDRVREEVRRDYDQQPGQHFYVDNEVVLSCWSEIWRWLNVSSLSSHLLKYGIVSDPSELYLLTSPYQTPRQRADHLLTLVYKGGAYGCHLLYMCIRDDDENPLGHGSAVEKLIAVGECWSLTHQYSLSLSLPLFLYSFLDSSLSPHSSS